MKNYDFPRYDNIVFRVNESRSRFYWYLIVSLLILLINLKTFKWLHCQYVWAILIINESVLLCIRSIIEKLIERQKKFTYVGTYIYATAFGKNIVFGITKTTFYNLKLTQYITNNYLSTTDNTD